MTEVAAHMDSEEYQQPIAIIGMACIFPGAGNMQQFWHNIQSGFNAITDVPESRWESVFYDPDSTAVDRFYCRKGGFIDEYADFDPLAYGIMPKAVETADPDQLLSLRVGIEALQDAGLWEREFNRQKTGVIIGKGNYLSAGTLRLEQHVRLVQQTLQTLQDLIPSIEPSQLQAVKAQISDQLSYYGPDTAVGLIPNLVASRLANRLDLKGPAYSVDGACASALLAVEQSCQLLRRGDADLMLTGGIHLSHDLTFWATFCQLGALSRSETISPLSKMADGILAGEGVGMLVLKRYEDAVNDGDRIYAKIRGIASSSDGRSSSLLAPAMEGQMLALQRAWRQAPLNRADIGLLEAHGTGTPAGDKAELETLAAFFGCEESADRKAALGSVKSMIGHTMPASGAAGLIKMALSVYHGILPMTLAAEQPSPLVEKTRFNLQAKTESWNQPSEERVAAVNAFGFGGINAHVVLSGHHHTETDSVELPHLVRISAPSQAALLSRLESRQWDDLAATADVQNNWRLVIIEPDTRRLATARSIVEKGKPWHGRSQIYFSNEALLVSGKIAFLFPGVDSTFNPQLNDVAQHFKLPLPDYCEKLDPATDLLKVGLGLTGVNKLLNQVLHTVGIRADLMAGHSIGEWSAMAASGCLSQTLIDEVNAKMDPDSLAVPNVRFLAVASGLTMLEGMWEDLDDLYLSHDNCPHQVIFCGTEQAVQALAQRLSEKQYLYQQLPIVSGFHSPLLAEYAKPFIDFFTGIDLAVPRVPLWSANTASEFPEQLKEKQKVIVKHLLEPVRFREMLINMHETGVRAFIQVGVGSLSGFVSDTLKSRSHLALTANTEKRTGMEQLCHVAAGLWVEGYAPEFALLCRPARTVIDNQKPVGDVRSASTMRLQLGVPLVQLKTPLKLNDIHEQQKSLATDVVPDDPLFTLFQQTMADIRQAEDDVKRLWMTRNRKATDVQSLPEETTIKMCLDVNDNIPWVLDHAFYPQAQGWPVIADRHPVIPLTMEVSLMRKAAEQVLPGKVIAVEQVRAFNWLVVEEPIDIEITVKPVSAVSAEVSIKNYAQATVILQADYSQPNHVHPLALTNPRPAAVTATQLYDDNWMFHGPAYQSIVELGPIADNGIHGKLKVSSGEGALLDNMGQLAGYWVMEEDVDCLAMPIGIERITFYSEDPEIGEELNCDVGIREIDETNCISDQQLYDKTGKLRVKIEGWHTRRYSLDKRFWIHSKEVHKYLLSNSLQPGVVIFEDQYDAAITRDYLAKRYLNQPETTRYNTVSPRKKRQWLNGRVAAKDAIRDYLWNKSGHYDFWPKELLIKNNELGKPDAYPHISSTYQEHLCISLSHKDKVSVAIAAERPVGIDIEIIAPRNESVVDVAMTQEETDLMRNSTTCCDIDELVTRIWVAKESVAKLQGTGFQGKPKAFVVEAIEQNRIKVNNCWVNCIKHNNYIIGWTMS